MEEQSIPFMVFLSIKNLAVKSSHILRTRQNRPCNVCIFGKHFVSICVPLLITTDFFFPGATTPLGVVFYSPLAGCSLLAYEVT